MLFELIKTTKKKNDHNKVYVQFYNSDEDLNIVAVRKEFHLNKDQWKNTCRVFDDQSRIYKKLYT